jgi:TolB-like protein
MPYKNTVKGLRQIAAELGVAYILEGSVQRTAIGSGSRHS